MLLCLVAEFSISQASYNASEQDGMVDVCVELSGQLERQITLELIPSNNTANTNDFNGNSLVYMFPPMSGNTVCNAVNITRDGVVESRESFVIELQEIPEDDAIVLGQSTAVVFIDDSPTDCKMFVMV